MSKSGRFYVKTTSGRVFCVEPIDDNPTRKRWGDIDPASKKLTGEYGMNDERRGSIKNEDSIITEENGFKNIITLPPGENPLDYIEKMLKEP